METTLIAYVDEDRTTGRYLESRKILKQERTRAPSRLPGTSLPSIPGRRGGAHHRDALGSGSGAFVTGFQDALRARPVAGSPYPTCTAAHGPMWRRAIEKSDKGAAEIAGAGITCIFVDS
jgi:hypothetical protein